MYVKSVRLQVPIHPSELWWHRRLVLVGLGLIVFGLLALAMGGVTAPWSLVSLLCSIWGLVLTSRNPVRLRIKSVEGDILVLSGVHPACLTSLPEWPFGDYKLASSL